MNYHNRKFRAVQNTANGETSEETIFLYQQEGDLVFSDYCGGAIIKGHLLAKVLPDGSLDMVYHQLNTKGELMTGKCKSVPELMDNGKIRLHETWQWTSGDLSMGSSIIEEIEEDHLL